MLNTQRYILTFLSAIFILSSGCQKSDLIGLEVDPDAAIETKLYPGTVEISTVKDDAIVTNGLAQTPFGYLVDPVFGDTQSDLAMAFNIPSTSFSFGAEALIDSVVLVLQFGTEVYGDSSRVNPVSVKAYPLDTIIASEAYYSTKNWKRKGELKDTLGTTLVKTFAKGLTRSVKRPVDGIPDTAVKLAPHLRIKLSKTKLSDILLSNKIDYTSTSSFRQSFKGVYLTMDKPAGTDIGALSFFDLQSASNISGLEVYYRNNTITGPADTNMVLFPTNSSITAASIKNRMGSTIVEENIEASNVYVQALGGYRTKVSFKKEIETLKGLVSAANGAKKVISVNRAEIIIPDVSADSVKYKPAPRLTLYRTDIAGLRKPVPDNAIGIDARYLSEIGFGGFRIYNAKKGKFEYRFIVTSYIQDLLSGKLTEYETFIAPIRNVFTGTSNITVSGTTAARAILPGKNHPTEKIRLEVIYTRPD